MRTKAELQQDILNIAMKIQMEFPELTTYIKEMPTLFSVKELDHKHTLTLEQYYTKLKTVLVEYAKKRLNLELLNGTDVLNFSSHTHSPLLKDAHSGKSTINLVSENHSKNQILIEDMISSDEKEFRII